MTKKELEERYARYARPLTAERAAAMLAAQIFDERDKVAFAGVSPKEGESEGEFRDRLQNIGYRSFWRGFTQDIDSKRESVGVHASRIAADLLRSQGFSV